MLSLQLQREGERERGGRGESSWTRTSKDRDILRTVADGCFLQQNAVTAVTEREREREREQERAQAKWRYKDSKGQHWRTGEQLLPVVEGHSLEQNRTEQSRVVVTSTLLF